MAIKPQDCLLVTIFATNVRRRRLELDFSQEELAERAGVHRTYVGMLERGEKNVTIYNIDRIAGALEVEPYVLLQNLEHAIELDR
ncbi:helix-turn-helix domain-containing protein [Pseudomonas veronii]|uniref:helix-turn-helix domain-containing protein n=1 Tax=Pseudomonas veronii TaxID=76761 RepID=UPI0006265F85|nr:helix-turn-helix transcriptional regulator [Pseudomonas veronii]